jgi:hypothetical protein
MSETHELETVWKEVGASLYETYAAAATNFLEHCDDLIEMFKFINDDKIHDDKVQQELRSVRSLINSKIADFQTLAEKLRAGGE